VSSSCHADLEAPEEVFTGDAVVHDAGRTHIGIDAIASWMDPVASAFPFIRAVRRANVQPGSAIVGVQVSGDFPGGPIELHHHFSLTDRRICARTLCT